MKSLDVSIIIVNWNTRDILRNCLRSVYEQTRDIAFEIIFIDNASSDGSADMVQNEFPRVFLIKNQNNRGFAAANNQGIKIARGRYVLLLNPDTIILDKAIEKIIAFADTHPDVGIAGCQVWENHHTIQRTCLPFPTLRNILFLHGGLKRLAPLGILGNQKNYDQWDRTTERSVDVVSGMFMLARQKAIQQVGLMDEDYFVFAEEIDWCYRFWKKSWRCVFTPSARIIHLDGGSKSTKQVSRKMYVQQQKSLLLFYKKNRGLITWIIVKYIFILNMLCKTVFWRTLSVFHRSTNAHQKAYRFSAALKFHLFGVEPSVD